MNREEKEVFLLIEKLRKDMELSEDEEDKLIQEIEFLSPDPEILDYIFDKKYEGLTTEGIVKKVFSYKPISL